VVPGIVQDARKITDPVVREADSLAERVKNRLPGLSADLPAKYDVLTGKKVDPYFEWYSVLGASTRSSERRSGPCRCPSWSLSDRVWDEVERSREVLRHARQPVELHSFSGAAQPRRGGRRSPPAAAWKSAAAVRQSVPRLGRRRFRDDQRRWPRRAWRSPLVSAEAERRAEQQIEVAS
jgi:hypothetical protein